MQRLLVGLVALAFIASLPIGARSAARLPFDPCHILPIVTPGPQKPKPGQRTPSPDETVCVVRLQHASAVDVAVALKTAFPTAFNAFGDARTNSLAMTAKTVDVAKAQVILDQIDVPETGLTAQIFDSYNVRYPVPNPIASGTATVGSSSADDLSNAVSGVLTALGSAAPIVKLTPDPSYPRIILSGTTAGIASAKTFLQQLDRRPGFIEIEARVYELDEHVARNFGLSITGNSIQTTVTELFASMGSASPTPAPVLQLGKLTKTPLSFGAQLNFLLLNGYVNLISEPRVSTLNGRLAILDLTNKFPFVSSTVSSQGVVVPTVTEYDTGTRLEIIPMINVDGTITAYLHPVYSTLTGFTGQGAPLVSRRETSTTLTLRHGQSVVISGLENQSTGETLNEIPPLSRLPLIGGLFRNRVREITRTHIFIVMTPTIINYGDITPAGRALPSQELPSPNPGLPTVAPPSLAPAAKAPSTPPRNPDLETPPPSLPIPSPFGSIVPGGTPPPLAQR